MSKRAGRNLDPARVRMAENVQRAKHELAMRMVSDRVKKDAEFAADVLRIAGETLREDIKKDARETIARAKETLPSDVDDSVTSKELENALTQGVIIHHQNGKTEILQKNDPKLPEAIKIAMEASDNFPETIIDEEVPLGDGFYAVKSDGGGEHIVHETELPSFPKDGE